MDKLTQKKRVVVVGGGMAGCAAAFYLQKQAKEQNLPIEAILIEGKERLGGKVQTVVKDGFVVERGPDSYLKRKASMTKLIEEVGLGDKIVSNTAGRSYVYARGKLNPMPEGSFMGIPVEVGPFVFSGLFSPLGKLRAGFDFILPASAPKQDQSLGAFLRHRFGDEVINHLIEPLLAGIYAGDIDEMSLMSVFPMFYEVEQKYGSIIRGIQKTMPRKPKQKSAAPKKGSKQGMFNTVTTGLESIISAIEKRLDEGTVRKNTRVQTIEKTEQGYKVNLSNDRVLMADAVILATEGRNLAKIFPHEEGLAWFKDLHATTVGNVAMAFSKSAIRQDIDGTGFLVARNNGFSITATTWTHKKWSHSAPKDKVLLRCYVGRPGEEEIVSQSDEEIIKVVLEDLRKIMNVTEEPEWSVITRWQDAMPQYTVGHKERITATKAYMAEHLPGIYFGGGSYEGSGLPDCIDQGVVAVENVMKHLGYAKKEA